MKIIFFGTPRFAANNLRYLIDSQYEIVGVVTPPDSKKGRGKDLKNCAVKEVALEMNIPVLQPEKLRSSEFVSALKVLQAELFVVVAFRMLPEVVWGMPSKGTINLHTSLLPKYRGAAPINRVLINGEKETGISTFFINNNIDSGAIIQQSIVKLTNKTTAGQLHEILVGKSNNLLASTINSIKDNSVEKRQQSNAVIIDAPKLTKDLLKINWNKSAADIHNLVRGLSPFIDENTMLKDVAICPSSWFVLKNEEGKEMRVKLLLSRHSSETNVSGTLESDQKSYLKVNLNKGSIFIEKLQVAGKNAMNISQFLSGNKVNDKWTIS